MYFSVHRYEHGGFWPNLRESDFHYTGSGVGKGFNVNVPLNKTKMGNADYLAIWHQLLLPLAYEVMFHFFYSNHLMQLILRLHTLEHLKKNALRLVQFQPELIIVSAGYDAALGCFEVLYEPSYLSYFFFSCVLHAISSVLILFSSPLVSIRH